MTDVKLPTDAEKAFTADRLKDCANIIRNGVFAGGYAPAIAACLQWLDAGASFFNPPPAPAAAPEPAPDLKVVPDEQK